MQERQCVCVDRTGEISWYACNEEGEKGVEIITSRKNGYEILRIQEDLSAKSDLSLVKAKIREYLSRGKVNLALAFTAKSYFHTQTISVLVQCIEMVHKRGGLLGIINPNEEIRDILRTINLDKLVRIFASEDSIGSLPPEQG